METPKIMPTSANGKSGSWEQAKESAHESIDNFADTARPKVEQFSASAQQAVDKLTSVASNVASQAADLFSTRYAKVRDVQENLMSDARIKIRDKPVAAVAIALAAGFLIRALWTSRRRY